MTTRTGRLSGIAAVLLVGGLAVGCSSSSNSSSQATTPKAATSSAATSSAATSAAPAAATTTITIQSFNFGAPLTVKPGETVKVVNKDSAPHTVTADDGKSFDAQAGPGSSSSFTAPMQPGTYKFHCTVHPSMHGSLTVSA